MNIKGLKLVQTCVACPEQYDVYREQDGKRDLVGYIRLRSDRFRVDCPYTGETTVLVHDFEGDGLKGIFDGEEERQLFLGKAADAINEWLAENQP